MAIQAVRPAPTVNRTMSHDQATEVAQFILDRQDECEVYVTFEKDDVILGLTPTEIIRIRLDGTNEPVEVTL